MSLKANMGPLCRPDAPGYISAPGLSPLITWKFKCRGLANKWHGKWVSEASGHYYYGSSVKLSGLDSWQSCLCNVRTQEFPWAELCFDGPALQSPVHFTPRPFACLLWTFGLVPSGPGSLPCPTLSDTKPLILELVKARINRPRLA